MEWTVYDKTGITERCAIRQLEYSGTWMGECFVTATITSPVPIDFAIGDYLIYRGERFEINYDPSVLKKARKNSTGDAFTYDSVKFNSLSDELTRCMFLDFVKDDNNIHYTSLPNFSFYAASIQDLADRIQANLDRIYTSDKKWTVEVHPEYVNKTDVNISVNGITVWEALALVNSQFDANFIVRGRTITIGTAGIAADNVFKYGKGNGLYEIERTAEIDQQIVTRLRAYGSTRNLPNHYYARLGTKYFASVIKIASINAENNFADFYIDLDYSDIYFTVPRMLDGGQVGYVLSVEIDEKSVRCSVTNGNGDYEGKCRLYAEFTSTSPTDPADEPDQNALQEFLLVLQEGKTIYFLDGVNGNKIPSEHADYPDIIPNNMAVSNLMLPGFPDETLDPYLDSDNQAAIGIREASVFFDGSSDEFPEIYPSMEGMTDKRRDNHIGHRGIGRGCIC